MLLRLIKKFIAWSILALIICLGVLGGQLYLFQKNTLPVSTQSPSFLIKSGSNIKSIAQDLTNQGYIEDPWLFIFLAKLKGLETKVRAGEYKLNDQLTPSTLLERFAKGVSIQYKITIIEGWNFKQLLEKLQTVPEIEHTLKGMSHSEIMAKLGHQQTHPEGMFFPDTYRFPKGTKDTDFLDRSFELMQKHLKREWGSRAKDLPIKTPYEALILASIIEKETGVAGERALISGVFMNRLRKNMKLQTDPTVIYGMGDRYDGDIRYRDLREDTPYNTYVHKGLTPTPIAMPGLDSIKAALHPADTAAIYFVAKGDGSHQFSKTLKEHNRAVKKYQLK